MRNILTGVGVGCETSVGSGDLCQHGVLFIAQFSTRLCQGGDQVLNYHSACTVFAEGVTAGLNTL
jgi:hypothetical protein